MAAKKAVKKAPSKPTRTKLSVVKSAPPPAEPIKIRVTGKSVLAKLDAVKPNPWNPNQMTEFQIESTRAGLIEEGWVAAYALLIWRTDEKGRAQNIIIDGEHRWRIAKDIGFKEGPMVFLDGITEAKAREMTVAFDNKRGKFEPNRLRELVLSIAIAEDPKLAFRLGFDDLTFASILEHVPTLPPDQFSEVSINAETHYCCPKCGYEWNGKANSKVNSEEKQARRTAKAAKKAAAKKKAETQH